MADDKRHTGSFEEYQRYLNGEMSPEEEHAFEKRMLGDAFEEEAFEGLSQVSSEELTTDMAELRKRLGEKTRKKQALPLWRIAASLALLGLASFLIYFLINTRPVAITEQAVPEGKVEKGLAIHEKEDTSAMREDGVLALEQEMKREEKAASEPPPVRKMKKTQEKSPKTHEKTTIIEVPDEEETKEDITADVDIEEEMEMLDTGIEDEVLEEVQKQNIIRPMARTAPEKLQTKKGELKLLEIHGKVIDAEDGLPLPGVNVIVENTTVGTVTNIDGKFYIKTPGDSSTTLRFNFIGYNEETVKVNGKDSVFVTLEPDVSALSEVVVMAYGTQSVEDQDEVRYVPPKPAGGNRKFRKYIKEHLIYPVTANEKKVKGTVVLRLKIAPDGSISDIVVVKSPGPEFTEEALRLIKEGPEWKPALRNDIPEAGEVVVRIRFRP